MIRNKNQFQVNSKIHQINTRQHANLHQPSANATKYQKGVHCIGVKVYNMVPFYIKAQIDNPKKFRAVWHKYLRENLFLFPEWIFWTPQLKSDMQFKLTHEGFGTHVPSLYLQVCIINMSVYIQPLSVTKENFLLKDYIYLLLTYPTIFIFTFTFTFTFNFYLYPYYILLH